MTDGGYYAIKGFEYQIDKTVFEILESTNETDPIGVEIIEDISSKNFVIQVKYQETQAFTPSKIKTPVINLLNNFRDDNEKNYFLYASFASYKRYEKFVGEDRHLSLKNLNKILGNKKDQFSKKIKNDFIKKFVLDFAPDFQQQFQQVIRKLQDEELGLASNTDEAIFYYSNIVDYIRKKITKTINPEDRVINRKELMDYVKSGKNIIFNSAFLEFKGEEKYLAFIKKKFSKIIRKEENLVMLGKVKHDPSYNMGKLILAVVEDYKGKKPQIDINPITFVVPDDHVEEAKKVIVGYDVNFNDGYENISFNSSIFFEKPLKEKKTLSNGRATETLERISFEMRLISESTFDSIVDYQNTPQMIYAFDHNIPERFESLPSVCVEGLSTKQIYEAIKF
ncbi:hypothetical protein GF362_00900 [Candidatus Dojkabacteria bacterium]|nr:hypothetical protein [Candidatus Dojkabacteria bacterium]